MSKALIIIPTYNEIENIAKIIDAVLSKKDNFHVLIVDDNSPDGTAEVVLNHPSINNKVFILQRAGKLGLGTAYIDGFRFGIEKGFDYILEMDADFSHDPNELVNLVDRCEKGADVCVGSRYTKGGGIKNWSKYRLMLSFGASLYVRLLTSLPVKDPTAGFICYKKHVLESIDLDKVRFVGYAFQIEMKYAAFTLGHTIVEHPIIFKDREEGVSKMNTSIVKEAMLGVIRMKGVNYAKN